MKLKSITFRCSPAQIDRLETAMNETPVDTRTMALSCALEEFLDFAEKADSRALDLFALVELIDRDNAGPAFADQA